MKIILFWVVVSEDSHLHNRRRENLKSHRVINYVYVIILCWFVTISLQTIQPYFDILQVFANFLFYTSSGAAVAQSV
jgi:hypothetical protein